MKQEFLYQIHNNLWLKSDRGIIGLKEAKNQLGQYRILKPIRFSTLKDLEELGLIYFENNKKIIVKKPKYIMLNSRNGYTKQKV